MTVPSSWKALTIRQPWASLICPGPGIAPVKTIESNRKQAWKYRGPVLIHAGKERVKPGTEVGAFVVEDIIGEGVDALFPIESRQTAADIVSMIRYGAVIGVARITDCMPVVADLGGPDDPMPRVCVTSRGLKLMRPFVFPSEDISDQEPYGVWTPGTHALVLDDIVSLPRPIPAVGRLGLWNPDDALVAAVEAQLEGVRRG